MPYRICKTFEIESGHMLSKHPDLCKFPHGHSRKVEFVLEAGELDQNEMVCDFKSLKEAMSQFLKAWGPRFVREHPGRATRHAQKSIRRPHHQL